MIGAMRKEYANLRRRPFLTPVWLLGLAAFLTLLVAAWAVVGASTTFIVVARHAEPVSGGGADPQLSVAGLERAVRLAQTFGTQQRGQSLDAVFVTQWQRSSQTARPLATRLALPVITLPADDVDALERRVYADFRGGHVLVIAQGERVPAIVAAFGAGAQVPPLADDDYGTAYLIAVPRWSRPAVLRIALP